MIAADRLAHFYDRLADVCARCGRDPADITLVAVTKMRTVDETNTLIAAGVTAIGENRVHDAIAKFTHLLAAERHLIGHLQTNKIREVVAHFDVVQSVDSIRLAEYLNVEAGRVGKRLRIFVQVNIAREETKSGFAMSDLAMAIAHIRTLPHLTLDGLMTIGPRTTDEATIRAVFDEGRRLVDALGLASYSAGMSDDWPLAIAAGATHLRIGRTLFCS